MTKDEFREVIQFLSTLMPDLGEWLKMRSQETLKIWFEEVFIHLELHDVRSAITGMSRDGLKSFDRDCLPSILSKSAQDIAYERSKRQDAVRERERRADEKATAQDIRASGQYKELLLRMAKYRGEHDAKKTPKEVIHEMTEDIFESMPDDDTQDGPRYRCLTCEDSGFVNYRDHKGRAFAGHCSCSKGEYRRTKFTERDRTLGAGTEKSGIGDWNE